MWLSLIFLILCSINSSPVFTCFSVSLFVTQWWFLPHPPPLFFFSFALSNLQQELAAIFKKIGDKQTCTIGLYELYRITQLYPKVSIWVWAFHLEDVYLIILLFFGWYQKSVTIVFDYLAKVFFPDFRLIYLLSSKMLVRHFARTLEMV